MKPVRINQIVYNQINKEQILFILTGVIIVIILLVLLIYNFLAYNKYSRLTSEYRLKAENLSSDIRKKASQNLEVNLTENEKQNIINDVAFVNRLIARDVFPWCYLLNTLEQEIPDGITLTNFIPSDNFNKLTLKGNANHIKNITLFLKNIEKTKMFHKSILMELDIDTKKSAKIHFIVKSVLQPDLVFSEEQYGTFGTYIKNR